LCCTARPLDRNDDVRAAFKSRNEDGRGGIMGLLDVLNGMQNGPRGARRGGGGMSPLTMALLGLLAYKGIKAFSGTRPAPDAMATPGRSSGSLGDMLRNVLGGGNGAAVGSGGLGGLLSGGLGDLLRQFQGAGKGDVANSWIGTGQNEPIAAHDLAKVLTPEQIEFLTERTGMSREELLAGLSEQLPRAVDELTPTGRLPTAEEMDRTVRAA
jgi:uncharacterized protein YidB (DUF937 family)